MGHSSIRQVVARWQGWARQIRRETYAVYLAMRDQRTPWHARVVALVVVAYAFSPIDLIPDFIPLLGYLDDLVIVPLGLALALRLIPKDVLAENRARADTNLAGKQSSGWVAACVVVLIWLVLAGLALSLLLPRLRSSYVAR